MNGIVARFQRQFENGRRRRRARRLLHWGRRAEAVIELALTVEGDWRPAEIALLYRMARRIEGPGELAQVGVHRGLATVVLAMARNDAVSGARIFAIDTMRGQRGGLDALRETLRRLGLGPGIEAMVAEPARAAESLQERGQELCLLLLDGSRQYEEVVEHIRLMRPLVREQGLVLLHGCEPDAEQADVWLAFQDELSEQVEVVERAGRLLVSRLRPRG